MRIEVVVFAGVLYALLTMWASILVIVDELSSPLQKIAQLALVWGIPVLGSLIVFGLHRKPEKPSGKYRQDLDAGDDFAMSGAGVRRTQEALDGD
ncbi:hypothetical protein GJV26_00280 [Massilia dura]|uniref:Uncharacterized protein n=1 Tax=Pseudoduganella dura TaxID=321982 RepID=A0A6I3X232_9BURK|nr:hypothetical protein [Pseudoduganella dura]MUI10934.1 hypothetical protein [Pseudoduganella dura]GGY02844.1 hypothetical protein GCM10007386_37210 [Pseudoduganella dura]